MTTKNKWVDTSFAADRIVQRFPFYYGWVMLPIAMLALISTSPGQTFGVSAFNPSIRAALGLSHSQLTGAYMVGTLLAAVPQPWLGSMMDKYGIRRIMIIVIICLGFACLFISQVRSYTMLFFAFFGLRTFGQGALTILASNTPAMWFRQKLGKVSALIGVGMAGATAAIPPLVLWLINQADWRTAYATLGVSVWLIMLPLLFTLFRNKPEDVGQFVDGMPPAKAQQFDVSADSNPAQLTSFSLKEAMQTRAYWIYLVTFGSWGMIFTAVTFNLLPLFVSAGLSEVTATATFTTLAGTMIITQLIGGVLADRVRLNRLASFSLIFITLSLGFLVNLQAVWMGHAYALFAGLGQGFLGAVNNTVWLRYFGRENLGKIRGSVWTATVAGSSLGPFLMGFNFDQTGNYAISLWGFLILYAFLVLVVLFATPPVTPR
jgi:MFS family permease